MIAKEEKNISITSENRNVIISANWKKQMKWAKSRRNVNRRFDYIVTNNTKAKDSKTTWVSHKLNSELLFWKLLHVISYVCSNLC